MAQSSRDRKLASNAAHKYYGLLYSKPPMIAETVSAPRERHAPRADATPKEHAEQVAVVKWWYWYSKTRGVHFKQLVAVPNGQLLFRFANNPNALLGYLHAEGMRDGMMDLVIFHAVAPWHGCLVEMKRISGSSVSDDQTEMARILSAAGYRCEVCYGADEAINVIKEYCE